MASPLKVYGEFLKWHISLLVAHIEALLVASTLGLGGLHDYIIFFGHEVIIPEVIKEIHSDRKLNVSLQ